jgi:hypothetical protein
LDGLQLLFEDFKIGKTSGTRQTHILDPILCEESEEGLRELLEVRLAGKFVLREQICKC